ncbi:MAG: tetratricopeptide repeat protein, partial [Candidatus Omnitrophota bacterium]
MRIINTSKFLLLTFNAFLVISILSGCNENSTIGRAKNYIKKSEVYYRQAEEIYNDLIKKGKNSDQLSFELGMLYYQRGDFDKAVKEFRISNLPEAERYLAIVLYKTGDFTDALALFEKDNFSDSESLYYYGLTCESLNLFDKALDIYARIEKEEFKAAANQRMNTIEKQNKGISVADIDAQAQRLIRESPGEREYPQAGALILDCNEQIEITGDNKEITTLHYLIKILNQRGKESFSETQ